MAEQLIDKNNERQYNVKSDAIGSMGITPYQETAGEEYMNEKQLAHIEKIVSLAPIINGRS
ncbi:DnaK suppressor protein [Legionella longbeachae D-4968]|nr:DnaK suppressor protein [Legionella longbeachae D-4968]